MTYPPMIGLKRKHAKNGDEPHAFLHAHVVELSYRRARRRDVPSKFLRLKMWGESSQLGTGTGGIRIG